MTAVILHHTKKDHKTLGKVMIYTDMNNGDYLAPIACIKAKLGADALEDLHYTLRSG
jgi:hypothetical protein